jgi:hypothetical protein
MDTLVVDKMNVGEVSIHASQRSITATAFGTEIFIALLSLLIKYHEIHHRVPFHA